MNVPFAHPIDPSHSLIPAPGLPYPKCCLKFALPCRMMLIATLLVAILTCSSVSPFGVILKPPPFFRSDFKSSLGAHVLARAPQGVVLDRVEKFTVARDAGHNHE